MKLHARVDARPVAVPPAGRRRRVGVRLPVIVTTSACVVGLAAIAVCQDRGRRGFAPPPPRIMEALDLDRDRGLSAAEIAAAAESLATLDFDGDGNLTTRELEPPRRDRRGRRRGGPPGMARTFPVMRALDLDRDGELFEDEVTDASGALLALDRDCDGALDAEELRPSFGGRGFPRPGGFPGPGGIGRDRGPDRGRSAGRLLAPAEVAFEDGTHGIPDHETFRKLSYQGDEVLIDTHLAGLEFVKFSVLGTDTDSPTIYFINTETHRAHMMFGNVVGIPPGGASGENGQMLGVLIWRPLQGIYTFEFEPNNAFPFERVAIAHAELVEHAPVLKGRLAYHPLPAAVAQYQRDREKYEQAELPVFLAATAFEQIAFLPLNQAVGFGLLRVMDGTRRPGPREVVLCPTLPNEMPRVAGVITAERQTPLSHVNLRAVQDRVPNAFVAGALDDPAITGLIGKYVRYQVRSDGFELRQAESTEVDAHFAHLRPAASRIPVRDLSVREIRSLDELGFDDAASVGTKSANLAVLRALDLPEGMVPSGYAIPFSFYDEFMRHNGLYGEYAELRDRAEFLTDAEARANALAKLRKKIRAGEMPGWMRGALTEVQAAFPAETRIRCRSSTNNEDLPGFSGAGLYDSFTHRPDEGHLEKSVKQVFASLWNFRAYEEREFHRVDHLAAAMGVLLHESFADERANGVAVTDDIVYQSNDQVRYYVNTQLGEDLVTNPEERSVPEELLLAPRNPRHDRLVRRSSRAADGDELLGPEHRAELRRALRVAEQGFRRLYAPPDGDPFAIEVEFKVTRDGAVAIKQARPWVY